MLDMKELLRFAVEQRVSDVHLAAGIPPKFRVNGKLTDVEMAPLKPQEVAEALGSTMNERHKAILKERGEVDFSFASPETGRFRVNVFMDRVPIFDSINSQVSILLNTLKIKIRSNMSSSDSSLMFSL